MRRSSANVLCIVVAALSLAISVNASAQSSGKITGTVVDETGAVIEGARVTVFDEKGAVRADTVTTTDGSFTVSGLTFGRYRVVVEANQFKSDQTVAELTPASTVVSLRLQLRVRAATEVVTVSAATRSNVKIEDLPVSASVVTQQEVRNTAAQSLDELLLATPGVNLQEPPSFVQHPTSNAVSMRGLGGGPALVAETTLERRFTDALDGQKLRRFRSHLRAGFTLHRERTCRLSSHSHVAALRIGLKSVQPHLYRFQQRI
jgi:outer membrane receptor protein involved in Fe transport